MNTSQTQIGIVPRYSQPLRKSLLVVHIIAGLSWIGIDIALLPLLYAAYTSGDPVVVASALRAISLVIPPTVPVLSLAILISGLLLGLGTTWGLTRYWWVLAKLALSILMTVLVFTVLVPAVTSLEVQAAAGATAQALRNSLGRALTALIFPPVVSASMLSLATILSVFKPWRRTPWTR
jgi:uncharacterized membrane protein